MVLGFHFGAVAACIGLATLTLEHAVLNYSAAPTTKPSSKWIEVVTASALVAMAFGLLVRSEALGMIALYVPAGLFAAGVILAQGRKFSWWFWSVLLLLVPSVLVVIAGPVW